MSFPLWQVNKAGIYTSIQDLGRYGYQQYGVPVSGAMDKIAIQIGNGLVGNERTAASIEVTMGGASFTALNRHLISITGANLEPRLNGKRAPMWCTLVVNAGDEISFKGPVRGLRAYVAVQGGLDAPTYLGSQSVYERGHMGKRIQDGDQLSSLQEMGQRKRIGLNPSNRPSYDKEVEVRIVESHHVTKLRDESREAFFNQSFTVSTGDRMGLKLDGEPISFKETGDIISEAVTYGTIQVPSNGQPIILMADSQTTGGYVTIGNIIKADLWKVAQLPPGGKVRFHSITHDEARSLSNQLTDFLSSLQKEARYMPPKP